MSDAEEHLNPTLADRDRMVMRATNLYAIDDTDDTGVWSGYV